MPPDDAHVLVLSDNGLCARVFTMGEHYKYTNIGQLHGDEYGKQMHMLVDTQPGPKASSKTREG